MYQGFLIQPELRTNIVERQSHAVPRADFKGFLKKNELEELILGGEPIDAEQVSNLLFPKGNPDVFLSHSYADRDAAIKIAEQMRELGLRVFIDSEVWGSVDDLLQKVDDEYCLNESGKIYSYQKRNRSTAHIYIILNSALHHMIDRSEAFIFVASESSLVTDDTETQVTNLDKAKTASPWIHSELLFSSMVRRQTPSRIEKQKARTTMQALDEVRALVVHHSAPLKHLNKIDDSVLTSWLSPASHRGDSHRTARVRTLGVIEGNRPCSDNDWEQIKQGGDRVIQKWIDAQMVGKSVVIVLIGSQTYGRKWVDYEIKKEWESGKGLLGIHVHNMKDLKGNTTKKGENPFSRFDLGGKNLSEIVPVYEPQFSESKSVYGHINESLSAWIEEASRVRSSYG